MNPILDRLFKSWRSTLIGVTAALALFAPPIHDWLVQTTTLDTGGLLGLIFVIVKLFQHDAQNAT